MGRIAICCAAALTLTIVSARAQPTSVSETTSVVYCRDVDVTRPMTPDQLRNAQACQEVSKLREEVASLRASNNAQRSGLGFLLPWSGIVTGLAAALGALLVPLIGFFVRNSFAKSEREKLLQERLLQRDQHNMRLMEGLGNANRAVQLASASSILGRIEEIKNQPGHAKTEIKTLTDVIVAVLRDPDLHLSASKYIADEMVTVFDLKTPNDGLSRVSALKSFNLQGARLVKAYWAGVSAQGVDFFGANLTGASLRNADLTKATFLGANLQNAVLAGANLTGANFKGADLSGADLTNAIGLDASMFDAQSKWNADTKWPVGFQMLEGSTAT